jgi:exopolyphosphatase / guanosine-5'-triphosphate,3'-diphosphate pyrophosphatase
MRLAAIDIGTNSIHMVIAGATGSGGFEVIDREREVVQIGRGSFTAGRLRADAIQRTISALTRYVQLARRHQVDRILCTATAAVREAKNGGDFLAQAKLVAGVTPRVIPAEEEGRLIYLGVKSALRLSETPALMVDIGGGSAQLVVGNRDKLQRVVSAPLGALRLTERLLASDPPSRRDLSRLDRTVRKALREPLAVVAGLEPQRAYGSSGSIHALAHIAHWSETGGPIQQINGHVLSLDSLRELSRRLQKMTTAEREKLPGIDSQRAGIIVPGAFVLRHILEALDFDGITISDFGVREGLVTDYITRHAQEITAAERVQDLRLRSVLQLAEKFQANLPHAQHVAKLALDLFDGLKPVHHLGDGDRDALQFAALLHDIGSAIGYDGHPEHSYYIIKHGNLRGLTADEVERVANVARFHSKGRPRKRVQSFSDLDRPGRRTVRWLSAILRVAEGLDRSHYQLIRSLTVVRRKGSITIRVAARREAQLELWAARRRSDLLATLIGVPVRIVAEKPALKPRAAKPEVKPAPAGRRATKAAPGKSGRVARRPVGGRSRANGTGARART